MIIFNIPYITQYTLHTIASVDCNWGAWRDPGACSKSCGGGTRSKIRVKLVEEKNGGQCIGKSIAFELCNMNSCPGNISDHIYIYSYKKFYSEHILTIYIVYHLV